MTEWLQREAIYLWYYLDIQFRQIAPYWAFGILLGSAVSVFGKKYIHGAFAGIGRRKMGWLGVIPASLLGIASPLCMYGTILAAEHDIHRVVAEARTGITVKRADHAPAAGDALGFLREPDQRFCGLHAAEAVVVPRLHRDPAIAVRNVGPLRRRRNGHFFKALTLRVPGRVQRSDCLVSFPDKGPERFERTRGIIRKLHGMRHGTHEFLRPSAGELPADYVFVQATAREPVLKRLHRSESILQPYSRRVALVHARTGGVAAKLIRMRILPNARRFEHQARQDPDLAGFETAYGKPKHFFGSREVISVFAFPETRIERTYAAEGVDAPVARIDGHEQQFVSRLRKARIIGFFRLVAHISAGRYGNAVDRQNRQCTFAGDRTDRHLDRSFLNRPGLLLLYRSETFAVKIVGLFFSSYRPVILHLFRSVLLILAALL